MEGCVIEMIEKTGADLNYSIIVGFSVIFHNIIIVMLIN